MIFFLSSDFRQDEVNHNEECNESQDDITHEFSVVLASAHHVSESLHAPSQKTLPSVEITTLKRKNKNSEIEYRFDSDILVSSHASIRREMFGE